ncbi:MAG TPA: MnmC family methyltransferase [Coleofasciculaceae cyanobacterium]|jgi:tRNA U34 5-methylaminomethyl-2-thiouridine-forming methyltransferase MnmC
MQDTSIFTPQLTADGSFTFFSTEFGESFHSVQGAKEEALLKFVKPCQLVEKAQKPLVRLLDVCYGLGYNTASALEAIWTNNPSCRVELVALELDPTVPRAAIAHNLLNNTAQPIPELLQLATSFHVQTDRLHAQLLLGDARTTIGQLHQSNFQADAIFLDPFSPPRCPQLWTVEFLQLLAKCCAIDGRLATYSCAASVRSALIAAGLKIGSTLQVGGRQPGTVASFSTTDLPPLSKRSQEHLQTRAAIPYRDPNLCDPAHDISHRRKMEQQASSLEPTSRWHRRWLKDASEARGDY